MQQTVRCPGRRASLPPQMAPWQNLPGRETRSRELGASCERHGGMFGWDDGAHLGDVWGGEREGHGRHWQEGYELSRHLILDQLDSLLGLPEDLLDGLDLKGSPFSQLIRATLQVDAVGFDKPPDLPNQQTPGTKPWLCFRNRWIVLGVKASEDRGSVPPHEGEKGVDGVAEEINDGHVLWQHNRKGVPVRVIPGAFVVLCKRERKCHVSVHLTRPAGC